MTTKLAVPPVPPTDLIAVTTVPETWQAAFIHLTDRFMRVIGKQAATIKDLTTGLEDANGVIAAGDRARADLLAQIEAMSNRIDLVRDSFLSAASAVEKTVSERLTDVENAATATAQRVTAVEGSVEAVAGRVDGLDTAVAADRTAAVATVARLDALDPRLVSIADVLDQTGTKLTNIDETLDAIGVRFDGLDQTTAAAAARVLALDGRLDVLDQTGATAAAGVLVLDGRVGVLADGLGAAVSALDQETKARTAAVAAVARSVDELSETASEQDGELNQKITALVERADGIERGVKLVDEAHGITAGQVRDLSGTVDAVRSETQAHALAIDEDRARLGKIEDGVESFIQITAAAGAEIKTFDGRLTRVADEATDACRRVTIALGEMPAAMMINRQGHLVRVSRAGDEVDLGCVIADGKDAADIVSARIEKGRLVFTRSDRTEFGCEMPAAVAPAPAAPVAPEIDPAALVGYLSKDANVRAMQVDDMRKMRTDKKTYAKIGEKYGTSARHVVRLLKGD